MIHIVINTTEHDVMHVEMLKMDNVKDVGGAAVNNLTVAIIWECEDVESADSQLSVLWDDIIPAVLVRSTAEESHIVNSIIHAAAKNVPY